MDERRILSRRQLQDNGRQGALAAADLACWEEPDPTAQSVGAAPVASSSACPSPSAMPSSNRSSSASIRRRRTSRSRWSSAPQAQARQKLITSITAGNPPDCCQVWDNWVGEFEGMGALKDLTAKSKEWKYYKDVLPIAWQTVTVHNKIASFALGRHQ